MARCTWPIDAAAIGVGSQVANTSSGAAPSSSRTTCGGQLGAHGRGVGLELGQRLADRLGQALVEVAGHLAELHQGALHVPERLGDALGGLQLEGGVELVAGARRTRTPCGRGASRTGRRPGRPTPATATLRALRLDDEIGPAAAAFGVDALLRLLHRERTGRRRGHDAEHLGDGAGRRHGGRGYRWLLASGRSRYVAQRWKDVDSINLALLVLRCGLGAVMLAHGINHIFGGGKIAGTARWFESLGMKPGIVHAWLASLTEIVGGALLVVGLLTPFGGAAVIGVMLVAIVTNHRGNGFFIFRPGEGWEYVMTLTLAGFAIAVLGAGEWSLDHASGHLRPARHRRPPDRAHRRRRRRRRPPRHRLAPPEARRRVGRRRRPAADRLSQERGGEVAGDGLGALGWTRMIE